MSDRTNLSVFPAFNGAICLGMVQVTQADKGPDLYIVIGEREDGMWFTGRWLDGNEEWHLGHYFRSRGLAMADFVDRVGDLW